MRLGLDVRRQLLGLDLAVAFEGNAVDHAVFLDDDYDTAALVADLHVGKQTVHRDP